MHTVKLKMEDNIYKNIMFILKNLQLKGLEIEEIYENTSSKTTKRKIKELFSNKKVDTFKAIDNPMQWQRQQRDEW
jgi:Txe/YoeB family toxin of Txe-Axe toxin-antitoxin module